MTLSARLPALSIALIALIALTLAACFSDAASGLNFGYGF